MKFIEVSSPVKIDKLVPGGQGIGTFTGEDLDKNNKSPENMRLLSLIGKKGFFWNVLPEEIVTRFTITKNKSHYFEAIAEEITNHSSHRVTPKDTCFLSTSPWQIMDYDYELKQKANLLQEMFSQADLSLAAGGVAGGTPSAGDLQVDAMGESATTGPAAKTTGPAAVKTDGNDFYYRNKMEYSLYWDVENSEIKLAQHARGSHRKVPLATSSIERPEIFKKAQEIVAELNANHEEARKYQSLLLRCDKSGKVEGGLFENKKPHPKFNNLEDEILGHKYSYSPNGFFQINLPIYEMVLAEIKSYVETDNVLDLYSGVGTIGLSVARDKHLTLVESNSAAYEELEKNCRATGPATPRAIFSNSEDALEYIAPDQTVILDPPRAGCDKKLIEKLLEIKPQRIIYLSCNPSTQARDVKLLEEKYQLIKVTPYNFFPRTPHLENLVVLDLR